jgi:hypothetical protein
MARNKINAEMEARKGRRRVQELLALGMRNDDAVRITAIEFCVQEVTVYLWRCGADDPTLNDAIGLREAQAKVIWDKVHTLSRYGSDGGKYAKTRKVAADEPRKNQRKAPQQGDLF